MGYDTVRASRKGGAPLGNKNAAGNHGGAPRGNRNALKHGGYAAITDLTPEERAYLSDSSNCTDEEEMLWHEIQLCTIRIARMMKMLDVSEEMYVARQVTSEKKRRFSSPEEEQLYREMVAAEINAGEKLPGEPYTLTTICQNTVDLQIRIHEVITRTQAVQMRCIESLAHLRALRSVQNPTTEIEDVAALREAIFGRR